MHGKHQSNVLSFARLHCFLVPNFEWELDLACDACELDSGLPNIKVRTAKPDNQITGITYANNATAINSSDGPTATTPMTNIWKHCRKLRFFCGANSSVIAMPKANRIDRPTIANPTSAETPDTRSDTTKTSSLSPARDWQMTIENDTTTIKKNSARTEN